MQVRLRSFLNSLAKKSLRLFVPGLALFLSACSGGLDPITPSGDWDLKTVYMQPGFRAFASLESSFPVKGAIRTVADPENDRPLYVYIEGDPPSGIGLTIPDFGLDKIMSRLSLVEGAKWPSLQLSFGASQDSTTPDRSIALRMAMQHKDDDVLYLGLPCHYFKPRLHEQCTRAFWDKERYSEEAVLSLDLALTKAKEQSGHKGPVILVGYSHGGTLATLLASQRTDVVGLISVASLLAVDANRAAEGEKPLFASLDPQSLTRHLLDLPHVHFSGEDDSIAPTENARTYRAYLGEDPLFWLFEEPGFDHLCCWDEDWSSLLFRATLLISQNARSYTPPDEGRSVLQTSPLTPLASPLLAAPIATTPPPPRLPDHRGRFVVQVGAYLKQINAEAQWNRFRDFMQSEARISTLPIADEFEDARGRLFTRIYAAAFDRQAEAEGLCRSFKTQGIPCWVHQVP